METHLVITIPLVIMQLYVHDILLARITAIYQHLFCFRYQKVIKRNSCVVELQTENEFGEIQFFIEYEGKSPMAILQLFDIKSSPFMCSKLQKLILRVEQSDTPKVARSVQDIVRKCVLIGMENELYICRIPNLYETD